MRQCEGIGGGGEKRAIANKRQKRRTQPQNQKPIPNRDARRAVDRQIQREVQERERRAVVAPALRREQVADVRGHVLVRPLAADDGRGEDGVRRREARGDGERGEEVEPRDERVYEPCGDEPALANNNESTR